MVQTYLRAKANSAIPSSDLVWRAALKSERFGPRLRLGAAPACRHSPRRYQKSIWSWPRRHPWENGHGRDDSAGGDLRHGVGEGAQPIR